MADTISISLPPDYEAPTEEDIKKAKKWTKLRNDNALHLSSLIEERLQDAIRQLTQIGYKYNCPTEQFQFSQDKDLREDVAKVMSEIEDDIMELVEQYSLNETNDKKRRSTLLPWLLALKSKGTKDLRSTLHERLKQFLYDTEAQIAAMKLAKYDLTKAISRALSTMHSVYTTPEVKAAFNKTSAATYIKSKGVHYGNVGLSSSGAVNVENFGKQTATITWMKSQLIGFKEDGAAGYYQLRGSLFPCSICDDEVGLHTGDIINDHYPHSSCMCFRVPIYSKEEAEAKNDERKKEYERLRNDKDYNVVEYNPNNGGLKATHKNHKKHENDKKTYFPERLTGDDLEKEFQDLSYNLGHSVIFRAEANNTTDLDMVLDNVKMDLVSVTRDSEAFNNQLGRKNDQLLKYNELYGENNNSVCMYFHDPSYYSYEKIEKGLNKLISYGADVRIQNVYVLLNDGTDIFKLEFP